MTQSGSVDGSDYPPVKEGESGQRYKTWKVLMKLTKLMDLHRLRNYYKSYAILALDTKPEASGQLVTRRKKHLE